MAPEHRDRWRIKELESVQKRGGRNMAGRFKVLIVAAALAGLAGCAYQDPYRVTDPFKSGGGWASGGYGYSPYGYYPYGGFSSYYGFGMTDPFYYRYGYPAYGYYRYPYPPVQYCLDANRDGRCDRRPTKHDDDGDADDGDHHGRGPVVKEPGRDRDRSSRFVPDERVGNPRPAVPDRSGSAPVSGGKKPPAPQADSGANAGRAGMTPRPAASPRTQPPSSRPAPAAPRAVPRVDDSPPPPPPPPPPPRARPGDRSSK
jgi:hypothetical protein